eukprot:m.61326 g.61326  ORF g.61326 m.61326 type:complete len:170 (+) comp7331_c0_seq4:390-899(+)
MTTTVGALGTRSCTVKADGTESGYFFGLAKSSQRFLVDPAQPQAAFAALESSGLDVDESLGGVFVTHHHWDHCEGNEEIRKQFPDVPIFGVDKRIVGLTDELAWGDRVELEGGLNIDVLQTDCHTSKHTAFALSVESEAPAAVFSGDALFVGGCGRFFEGTAGAAGHFF